MQIECMHAAHHYFATKTITARVTEIYLATTYYILASIAVTKNHYPPGKHDASLF